MTSVKKNFIYNSIYQVLLILIPLITTPYLSRVLGSNGIGEYSYYYSIAYYFGIFILLGLNNYGNRTIAQVRNDSDQLRKTFWSIYFLQLTLGFIVGLLYFVFCLRLLDSSLVPMIMGIYVISNIFDINWLFFGLEKFKITVTRNIIVKIITTSCIFLFVRDSEDVWIYCLIMVSGMLVSQIVLWPYALRYIKLYRPSYSEIIVHFKPNVVLFLTVLATSLFKIMDKIMLGTMTTVQQVGFYESSERVIAIPIALIVSLGTVMLPRMANMLANNKEQEVESLIAKSVSFAIFLSSSMCFGIMGIAKCFVPLFYGEGFTECIKLFLILMPSCLFLAFANVIRTQYLLPNKMDRVYVNSAFIGAGINIVTNLILIPQLYASGAAIGTLFAEIAVCVYQCASVRSILPLSDYIKNGLPFIISGTVMFLSLYLFEITQFSPIVNLIIMIVLGMLLYFIVLIIEEIVFRLFLKHGFLQNTCLAFLVLK